MKAVNCFKPVLLVLNLASSFVISQVANQVVRYVSVLYLLTCFVHIYRRVVQLLHLMKHSSSVRKL